MSAVLQPVCGRQGTQPAARRGVREASGGAGDSQVEETLVGVSQEKGLYIFYTRRRGLLPSQPLLQPDRSLALPRTAPAGRAWGSSAGLALGGSGGCTLGRAVAK